MSTFVLETLPHTKVQWQPSMKPFLSTKKGNSKSQRELCGREQEHNWERQRCRTCLSKCVRDAKESNGKNVKWCVK